MQIAILNFINSYLLKGQGQIITVLILWHKWIRYVKLNIIFFCDALFYSLPGKFTSTAPTFYIYYLSHFRNKNSESH